MATIVLDAPTIARTMSGKPLTLERNTVIRLAATRPTAGEGRVLNGFVHRQGCKDLWVEVPGFPYTVRLDG